MKKSFESPDLAGKFAGGLVGRGRHGVAVQIARMGEIAIEYAPARKLRDLLGHPHSQRDIGFTFAF